MSTLVAPPAPAPFPVDAEVQVWFGGHCIIDWVGPVENAPRYAAAMRRRFASLRVVGPTPVRR